MNVLDKCFSKDLHEINFSFREYIKLHYLKCENKWNEEVSWWLENEDDPDARKYASGKSLRMGEWDWDPWAALTHVPTPGQATVLRLSANTVHFLSLSSPTKHCPRPRTIPTLSMFPLPLPASLSACAQTVALREPRHWKGAHLL